MARTQKSEHRAINRIFDAMPNREELGSVRDHTQSGSSLGSATFRTQIEEAMGKKTGQPLRGRPLKKFLKR